MKRAFQSFLVLCLVFVAAGATAQANPCNPCNPCGKTKNACNPCNPCGKTMNACNPCNPCGNMAAAGKMPAVNPCHQKFGEMFYFNDAMRRNSVTFNSQAPLEDIVGTSNDVTGYVAFRRADRSPALVGAFEVPIATLDTGIPMRNEHLASDMWLNAKSNPTISFVIDRVDRAYQIQNSSEFQTFKMDLIGPFTLNGITRQMRVPARLTWLAESDKTKMRMPGDLVGIRAEFNVPLRDFGITGPAGMDLVGSKVSDTIAIKVSLFGTNTMKSGMNPCNPCNACNPCGKGMNPCNPCNPCGKGKNPCNPCNPCNKRSGG